MCALTMQAERSSSSVSGGVLSRCIIEATACSCGAMSTRCAFHYSFCRRFMVGALQPVLAKVEHLSKKHAHIYFPPQRLS